MADVTRDESTGEITKITYRDANGYRLEIKPQSPLDGRFRICSTNPTGGGYPVDMEPSEVRKAAHDLLELVGEGD